MTDGRATAYSEREREFTFANKKLSQKQNYPKAFRYCTAGVAEK